MLVLETPDLLEAKQGFVEFETGKMTRAGGGVGNFTEACGRLYEELCLQGAMEIHGDDIQHQGLKGKLD